MKQSVFLGASLLLASYSACSAVPAEGWYAGLMGTASYVPTVNINNITHPTTRFPFTNAKVTHGIGGGGGGQIGYRICYFRVEGELMVDFNPYSKATINGFSFKRHFVPFPTPQFGIKMSGNTSFGAGLINGFYDIYDEDDNPSFVPYVGLGIGYARIQNQINFRTITQATGQVSLGGTKVSSSAPIGQAILGLNYFYSDETSFGIDYRYMTTKTINSLGSRFQAHTVNLLFNYTFSEH
jgi:opacity protein-like surface antigen